METVIFNTKQEADLLQERDFLLYLASIENPIAKEQTTAWAVPKQRIDGKWDYPVLEGADYLGYNTEPFDIQNYLMEIEE